MDPGADTRGFMPRQKQYPQPGPLSLEVGAEIGAAAAETFDHLAQVANKVHTDRMNLKVRKAGVDASNRFRMKILELEKDAPEDMEKWKNEIESEELSIRSEIGSQFSGLWSKAFEISLTNARGDANVAMATKYIKLEKDKGKAEFFHSYLDLLEKVRHGMSAERAKVLWNELEKIGDPFFSDVEMFGFSKTFHEKAVYYDARNKALSLGYEAGLEWLTSPSNVPDLPEKARRELKADLNREWGVLKLAEKEKQDKMVDDWENNALVKMQNKTLTFNEIMGSPLSSAEKEHWVDKLNRQAAAGHKEEDDPFDITDPATRAVVWDRILNDPHSITKEDLQKLHGNGLSTTEYKLADKAWKAAVEPEKDPDPLKSVLYKRMQSRLLQARTNQTWKKGKSNKDIEENNAGYMKAADAVDQLFLDNPDITNEELEKWWTGYMAPLEKESVFARIADLFVTDSSAGTKSLANIWEAQGARPPETFSEKTFQEWYAAWAARTGIDTDPDNPKHMYDYRAAYRAGAIPRISPEDGLYHWPSTFKREGHPNKIVDGIDTRTGLPEGLDEKTLRHNMTKFNKTREEVIERYLQKRNK